MPPLHNRSERICIETAYLILLTLPHGLTRAMLQPALANLLDTIVKITDTDTEIIQTDFETSRKEIFSSAIESELNSWD